MWPSYGSPENDRAPAISPRFSVMAKLIFDTELIELARLAFADNLDFRRV